MVSSLVMFDFFLATMLTAKTCAGQRKVLTVTILKLNLYIKVELGIVLGKTCLSTRTFNYPSKLDSLHLENIYEAG